MELEWDRSAPAQALSLQRIRELTTGSGIDAVSATLIEEGLANTNYRLLSSDGLAYHLRILDRNPSGLATEVAVMKRMTGKLPVPAVQFWSEAHVLLVCEWVGGQTLQRIEAGGDTTSVLGLGRQIGQILGALRSERFERAGLLGPALQVADAWPSVYDGLYGFMEHAAQSENCQARTPPELLARVLAAWERAESDLRRASEQPCLSHADFKPSNIMVDVGRISALLDWEFAHAGTWLLDAGQILRYMGDRKRDLAARIGEGMREAGGDLPQNWPALAATVDMANLCDFLGRPSLAERQREALLRLLADEIEFAETG